ncbi:uncharacterized protein MONOS_3635 [Monocercomonoides exilis]|uniref:uncharacterized protein n=1 Tax=Monocercomonoides exilis TaxID=2049356 RepID=UPI003559687F|nr:hypothetical protein MONOS_3635 [Monocercomonoides exilis]|eukprot:MONOS_3635.1-p1 / transcript=MONOS_3635.1 / gene=MONOS_3635 / organism=Monocercomonoides_exilis_PA203 / gene_product=unspecified product / transcript_product=unspecified product / location=Mono_scaffold00087:52796-62068(-) / protein_length=3091 / sequence_SO=supercontig / SO=protein_coding / is_pseudo=false
MSTFSLQLLSSNDAIKRSFEQFAKHRFQQDDLFFRQEISGIFSELQSVGKKSIQKMMFDPTSPMPFCSPEHRMTSLVFFMNFLVSPLDGLKDVMHVQVVVMLMNRMMSSLQTKETTRKNYTAKDKQPKDLKRANSAISLSESKEYNNEEDGRVDLSEDVDDQKIEVDKEEGTITEIDNKSYQLSTSSPFQNAEFTSGMKMETNDSVDAAPGLEISAISTPSSFPSSRTSKKIQSQSDKVIEILHFVEQGKSHIDDLAPSCYLSLLIARCLINYNLTNNKEQLEQLSAKERAYLPSVLILQQSLSFTSMWMMCLLNVEPLFALPFSQLLFSMLSPSAIPPPPTLDKINSINQPTLYSDIYHRSLRGICKALKAFVSHQICTKGDPRLFVPQPASASSSSSSSSSQPSFSSPPSSAFALSRVEARTKFLSLFNDLLPVIRDAFAFCWEEHRQWKVWSASNSFFDNSDAQQSRNSLDSCIFPTAGDVKDSLNILTDLVKTVFEKHSNIFPFSMPIVCEGEKHEILFSQRFKAWEAEKEKRNNKYNKAMKKWNKTKSELESQIAHRNVMPLQNVDNMKFDFRGCFNQKEILVMLLQLLAQNFAEHYSSPNAMFSRHYSQNLSRMGSSDFTIFRMNAKSDEDVDALWRKTLSNLFKKDEEAKQFSKQLEERGERDKYDTMLSVLCEAVKASNTLSPNVKQVFFQKCKYAQNTASKQYFPASQLQMPQMRRTRMSMDSIDDLDSMDEQDAGISSSFLTKTPKFFLDGFEEYVPLTEEQKNEVLRLLPPKPTKPNILPLPTFEPISFQSYDLRSVYCSSTFSSSSSSMTASSVQSILSIKEYLAPSLALSPLISSWLSFLAKIISAPLLPLESFKNIKSCIESLDFNITYDDGCSEWVESLSKRSSFVESILAKQDQSLINESDIGQTSFSSIKDDDDMNSLSEEDSEDKDIGMSDDQSQDSSSESDNSNTRSGWKSSSLNRGNESLRKILAKKNSYFSPSFPFLPSIKKTSTSEMLQRVDALRKHKSIQRNLPSVILNLLWKHSLIPFFVSLLPFAFNQITLLLHQLRGEGSTNTEQQLRRVMSVWLSSEALLVPIRSTSPTFSSHFNNLSSISFQKDPFPSFPNEALVSESNPFRASQPSVKLLDTALLSSLLSLISTPHLLLGIDVIAIFRNLLLSSGKNLVAALQQCKESTSRELSQKLLAIAQQLTRMNLEAGAPINRSAIPAPTILASAASTPQQVPDGRTQFAPVLLQTATQEGVSVSSFVLTKSQRKALQCMYYSLMGLALCSLPQWDDICAIFMCVHRICINVGDPDTFSKFNIPFVDPDEIFDEEANSDKGKNEKEKERDDEFNENDDQSTQDRTKRTSSNNMLMEDDSSGITEESKATQYMKESMDPFSSLIREQSNDTETNKQKENLKKSTTIKEKSKLLVETITNSVQLLSRCINVCTIALPEWLKDADKSTQDSAQHQSASASSASSFQSSLQIDGPTLLPHFFINVSLTLIGSVGKWLTHPTCFSLLSDIFPFVVAALGFSSPSAKFHALLIRFLSWLKSKQMTSNLLSSSQISEQMVEWLFMSSKASRTCNNLNVQLNDAKRQEFSRASFRNALRMNVGSSPHTFSFYHDVEEMNGKTVGSDFVYHSDKEAEAVESQMSEKTDIFSDISGSKTDKDRQFIQTELGESKSEGGSNAAATSGKGEDGDEVELKELQSDEIALQCDPRLRILLSDENEYFDCFTESRSFSGSESERFQNFLNDFTESILDDNDDFSNEEERLKEENGNTDGNLGNMEAQSNTEEFDTHLHSFEKKKVLTSSRNQMLNPIWIDLLPVKAIFPSTHLFNANLQNLSSSSNSLQMLLCSSPTSLEIYKIPHYSRMILFRHKLDAVLLPYSGLFPNALNRKHLLAYAQRAINEIIQHITIHTYLNEEDHVQSQNLNSMNQISSTLMSEKLISPSVSSEILHVLGSFLISLVAIFPTLDLPTQQNTLPSICTVLLNIYKLITEKGKKDQIYQKKLKQREELRGKQDASSSSSSRLLAIASEEQIKQRGYHNSYRANYTENDSCSAGSNLASTIHFDSSEYMPFFTFASFYHSFISALPSGSEQLSSFLQSVQQYLQECQEKQLVSASSLDFAARSTFYPFFPPPTSIYWVVLSLVDAIICQMPQCRQNTDICSVPHFLEQAKMASFAFQLLFTLFEAICQTGSTLNSTINILIQWQVNESNKKKAVCPELAPNPSLLNEEEKRALNNRIELKAEVFHQLVFVFVHRAVQLFQIISNFASLMKGSKNIHCTFLEPVIRSFARALLCLFKKANLSTIILFHPIVESTFHFNFTQLLQNAIFPPSSNDFLSSLQSNKNNLQNQSNQIASSGASTIFPSQPQMTTSNQSIASNSINSLSVDDTSHSSDTLSSRHFENNEAFYPASSIIGIAKYLVGIAQLPVDAVTLPNPAKKENIQMWIEERKKYVNAKHISATHPQLQSTATVQSSLFSGKMDESALPIFVYSQHLWMKNPSDLEAHYSLQMCPPESSLNFIFDNLVLSQKTLSSVVSRVQFVTHLRFILLHKLFLCYAASLKSCICQLAAESPFASDVLSSTACLFYSLCEALTINLKRLKKQKFAAVYYSSAKTASFLLSRILPIEPLIALANPSLFVFASSVLFVQNTQVIDDCLHAVKSFAELCCEANCPSAAVSNGIAPFGGEDILLYPSCVMSESELNSDEEMFLLCSSDKLKKGNIEEKEAKLLSHINEFSQQIGGFEGMNSELGATSNASRTNGMMQPIGSAVKKEVPSTLFPDLTIDAENGTSQKIEHPGYNINIARSSLQASKSYFDQALRQITTDSSISRLLNPLSYLWMEWAPAIISLLIYFIHAPIQTSKLSFSAVGKTAAQFLWVSHSEMNSSAEGIQFESSETSCNLTDSEIFASLRCPQMEEPSEMPISSLFRKFSIDQQENLTSQPNRIRQLFGSDAQSNSEVATWRQAASASLKFLPECGGASIGNINLLLKMLTTLCEFLPNTHMKMVLFISEYFNKSLSELPGITSPARDQNAMSPVQEDSLKSIPSCFVNAKSLLSTITEIRGRGASGEINQYIQKLFPRKGVSEKQNTS